MAKKSGGTWKFNDPMPRIQNAGQRGVALAGQHVLGESRKVVPHDKGDLERSGRVSADGQGTSARAAISYNTPYAVRQHENTHYRHKKGRKAKYLEGPLNQNQGTVRGIIARVLKGEL